MTEEEEKIIRQVKTMLENATPFDMPPSRYNALETMVNLIEKQQKEIEHRDKKLKDIENHIRAELKMIEKCYNEVNLFSKQQYDGMMASYKCLLNIFFGEVEDEN